MSSKTRIHVDVDCSSEAGNKALWSTIQFIPRAATVDMLSSLAVIHACSYLHDALEEASKDLGDDEHTKVDLSDEQFDGAIDLAYERGIAAMPESFLARNEIPDDVARKVKHSTKEMLLRLFESVGTTTTDSK